VGHRGERGWFSKSKGAPLAAHFIFPRHSCKDLCCRLAQAGRGSREDVVSARKPKLGALNSLWQVLLGSTGARDVRVPRRARCAGGGVAGQSCGRALLECVEPAL
jgi:hypothetical protein